VVEAFFQKKGEVMPKVDLISYTDGNSNFNLEKDFFNMPDLTNSAQRNNSGLALSFANFNKYDLSKPKEFTQFFRDNGGTFNSLGFIPDLDGGVGSVTS